MTFTTRRRAGAWVAAAGLVLALTACDDDAPDGTASPPGGSQPSASPDTTTDAPDAATGGTDAGDDGRAFDSTDDAVITAVETALSGQNARAHWDGSTLVVAVDGSIDDPTAGLHCLTPNTLIAAEETAVMRYADGDFDCEERR